MDNKQEITATLDLFRKFQNGAVKLNFQKLLKVQEVCYICFMILEEAKEVLLSPEKFQGNAIWGKVAEGLVKPVEVKMHQLRNTRVPFSIYGENEIDEQAKFQLYDALKLPIAVQGALMPDAHYGYGLPIGGVLATDNAVIPYGVGVDIGCRMCLTVYPIPVSFLKGKQHQYENI